MKNSMYRMAKRVFVLAMTVSLLMSSVAFAATYATLEFGSKGSEVLALQKALVTLGYEPKGTDGKFGRGTEYAVAQYQRAVGLKDDGKAGNLTLTRMYQDLANNGVSNGADSSTVTGTTTNPNTLKYGDNGSKVTTLQTSLVALGYNTNGIDGRFGAGTQRAVISFQKAQGLTADGLAGTQTLALINSLVSSGSGSSSSGNTGSSSGSSAYTRTLRKGYTGNDVKAVQVRLQELGYYSGTLDGVYGTGSVSGIKSFQQRSGLTADGLAGIQTFNKLFSASAISAGGSSSGSSSGSNTGSGSSSGTYITLRLGDKGSDVKNMQAALKSLNYSVSADGTFGAMTQSAVIAFQSRNGLTSDGVAGAQTQQTLYSGSAKAAGSDGSSSGSGSSGSGSSGNGSGGSVSAPGVGEIKLLHWFNDIKPTIRSGQTVTVYDPASGSQWNLYLYSLGRHADSEPRTLSDTEIMNQAFGNATTWTPKPVYVQLPNGTWTVASMHNTPHLSGSIKDNGFDGHLCVHFLRDMEETKKNDPNYGVTNQNVIRNKWKQLTGITVE